VPDPLAHLGSGRQHRCGHPPICCACRVAQDRVGKVNDKRERSWVHCPLSTGSAWPQGWNRASAQRVRSTSLVVRRLDVRHRARRDLYGFRRRLPSHELVRNSSAVPGERRLLVRRGKRCAGRLRCGVGSEPAEQHYVVPAAEARDCPPRRLLCGEAGSLQRRAGGVAELGGHDDGWCVGLPGPGAKEVLTAGEPGASGTACSGHSRGSTGSDSRARTAKTGSWIRHSASRCTARSSASMPSAYSRAARERLCPRPRSRSLSRFSGSV